MSNFERGMELLQDSDIASFERILADRPAIAEASDASGVSLLMHALYRRRADLAHVLAAHKTALDVFESASLGKLDRLSECLQDPTIINAQSGDGFTALHYACYFGQPDAARLLLEKGAASEAVAANPMRVMPLHSAASARNVAAARILLEAGASPNSRQHGGWSPLHAAAQNGDRAMVELLLRHGADPAAPNDDGKTAPELAREKGHQELGSYLEGQTPRQ